VFTVESGRVRSDDLTTISLILDAVKGDFPYGVIINKCTKNYLKALKDEETREAVTTSLNAGHRPTNNFFFHPLIDDLMDASGKYKKHEPLEEFLKNLPSYIIKPKIVKSIDTSTFDELKMKNEKLLKDIKESKEEFKRHKKEIAKMLKEQERKHKEEKEEQERKHKEDKEEQERKYKEEKEEQERKHKEEKENKLSRKRNIEYNENDTNEPTKKQKKKKSRTCT